MLITRSTHGLSRCGEAASAIYGLTIHAALRFELAGDLQTTQLTTQGEKVSRDERPGLTYLVMPGFPASSLEMKSARAINTSTMMTREIPKPMRRYFDSAMALSPAS